MGAFLLYNKRTAINRKKALQAFEDQGFKSPEEFSMGNYVLLSFRKQLIDVNNHIAVNGFLLFAYGSFVYKNRSWHESLSEFLTDTILNQTDNRQIIGNYVVVIYNPNDKNIRILVDPSYIKNVYCHEQAGILASCFLPLFHAAPGVKQINPVSVREILLTGALMGAKTLIKEIVRIEKNNSPTLSGIEFNAAFPDPLPAPNSFTGQVDHQLEILKSYFASLHDLSADFGADIGLTGGFDSRILLALGRKHLDGLQTNSFWRENNTDFNIARELAATAGTPFHFVKTAGMESDPDKIILNMDEAYHFLDGHVRAQSYWMEVFNTRKYAVAMLNGKGIGFHGCGGEQYRNHDRFRGGRISLESWVYYDLIFKFCGDCFMDKKTKIETIEQLAEEIGSVLGISSPFLGLREIKRYYNEIWNRSNRTLRLNMLNKLAFYFAPFTELIVAREAYAAIPHLGTSFRFQLEMLRRLDSELAAVRSNYGFAFNKREPFSLKALPFAISLIPRSLKYKLYLSNKKMLENRETVNLADNSAKVKSLINNVRSLSCGINVDQVLRSKVHGRLVIDMGYFIEKIKSDLS